MVWPVLLNVLYPIIEALPLMMTPALIVHNPRTPASSGWRVKL
jgi:hypothetical protein